MTINNETYPQGEDGNTRQPSLSSIARRLRPGAQLNAVSIEDDLAETLKVEEQNEQVSHPENWSHAAQQTRLWFRFAAFLFLGCFIIGWPMGTMWANYAQTGTLSFQLGFTFPIFLNMLTIPILIYLVGHALALGLRMASKAEELERSASNLLRPETQAISGVRAVGTAVKAEIKTLNLHLDEALAKLASVESMIRQQVQAIDNSAIAIEEGTSHSTNLVMAEREKLIKLTENLNHEADAFAEAIAEKAKLGLEQSEAANARILGAENELEEHLGKLENTASKALEAFDRLSLIIEQKETLVTSTSANLDQISKQAADKSNATAQTLQQNTNTIAAAQTRLQEESKRLETLIDDQHDRAKRLADAITAQTDKLVEASTRQQEAQVAFSTPTSTPVASPPPGRRANTTPRPATPPPQTVPSPHVHKPLTLGGISQATDTKPTQNAPLPLRKSRPTLPPGKRAASIKEERQTKSWSDILAAADEQEEDLQPIPAPTPNHSHHENHETPLSAMLSEDTNSTVISLVRNMQEFMLALEDTLYGQPQQATIVRFEGGERNIFANMLLRRPEGEVKNRIRLETARNEEFTQQIYGFLANFDRLLEPATDEQDSEALIDDYLGSPLGQVYLLTGSAMGYFS